VTSVGWHTRGRFHFSGSEDGNVKIWTQGSPEAVLTLESKTPVASVAILPNMVDLVVADRDGCVKLWDLKTGKCRQQSRVTKGPAAARRLPLSAIAVAPRTSCIVAASHSGLVHSWNRDKTDGSIMLRPAAGAPLAAHTDYVTAIRFHPILGTMATCSADSTVRIWKPKPVVAAASPSSASSSASASASEASAPPSAGAASASAEHVSGSPSGAVSDSQEAWEAVGSLIGHEGWVWDAAFNTDGSYLLTGSSDSTARLWDMTKCEMVQTFAGHNKGVCAVAVHDAQEPAAKARRAQ
jgi:G protein beta subunit-like protein